MTPSKPLFEGQPWERHREARGRLRLRRRCRGQGLRLWRPSRRWCVRLWALAGGAPSSLGVRGLGPSTRGEAGAPSKDPSLVHSAVRADPQSRRHRVGDGREGRAGPCPRTGEWGTPGLARCCRGRRGSPAGRQDGASHDPWGCGAWSPWALGLAQLRGLRPVGFVLRKDAPCFLPTRAPGSRGGGSGPPGSEGGSRTQPRARHASPRHDSSEGCSCLATGRPSCPVLARGGGDRGGAGRALPLPLPLPPTPALLAACGHLAPGPTAGDTGLFPL